MLWGTLTAQEGTDQNLRATNVYKHKGGPAEENKGEIHPRFWKAFHGSPPSQPSSGALIRLKSHQSTGTAEMELKISLNITETFRVWAGSILRLC